MLRDKNFIVGLVCGIAIVVIVLVAGLRMETRGYTEINCTTKIETKVSITELKMFNWALKQNISRYEFIS